MRHGEGLPGGKVRRHRARCPPSGGQRISKGWGAQREIAPDWPRRCPREVAILHYSVLCISVHPWEQVGSTGTGSRGRVCKATKDTCVSTLGCRHNTSTLTAPHQAFQHPPCIKSRTNVLLLNTNRNPFPSSSGGQKSTIRAASAGPCSFWRRSFCSLDLPAGPLAPGNPWLAGPITQSLPLRSHGLFPSLLHTGTCRASTLQ